jgi:hypothetical protein
MEAVVIKTLHSPFHLYCISAQRIAPSHTYHSP